jgi:hypothetical protein
MLSMGEGGGPDGVPQVVPINGFQGAQGEPKRNTPLAGP